MRRVTASAVLALFLAHTSGFAVAAGQASPAIPTLGQQFSLQIAALVSAAKNTYVFAVLSNTAERWQAMHAAVPQPIEKRAVLLPREARIVPHVAPVAIRGGGHGDRPLTPDLPVLPHIAKRAPRIAPPLRRAANATLRMAGRQTSSVNTASPNASGYNLWWTYEETAIPGVGSAMVNVANGNLLVSIDDIDLSERGIDLAFRRVYNSASQHDYANTDGSVPSNFGNGWTNSFDEHIATNSEGGISLYDLDGARYDFGSNGTNCLTPPIGVHSSLCLVTVNGALAYQWTKKAGTVYQFYLPTLSGSQAAYAGRIDRIFARNQNNWVRVDYSWTNNDSSSAANLAQINAVHANGQSLTLTFANFGSFRELASVTRNADGQRVIYGYDGSGNLTDVCEIGNFGPNQTVSDAVCANDSTNPHIHHQYAYTSGTYLLSRINSPNFVMQQSASTPGSYTQFFYDTSNHVTSVLKNGIINPTPQDGVLTASAIQGSVSTGTIQYWAGTFSGYAGSTTFSDTDGHSSIWAYDSTGRVTQAQAYSGSQWLITSATWDGNNNLIENVDARGYATDYAYDQNGNTIAVAAAQITTANQGTLRPTSLYSYDGNNNLTAYCDPNSNATGRNWPGTGTPPVCPGGSGTTHYTWSTSSSDPMGYLTDSYTPLGYHVNFQYNISMEGGDFGLPTDVIGDCMPQNDGTNLCPHEKFTYDSIGLGNLVSYDKGTGGAWILTYDSDNRVTTIADPDSINYVSYKYYFPNGQIQKTETPYQHGTGTGPSLMYDADGNAVTQTTWHGGAYSATGSPALPTIASITHKFYDAADRLVEVTQPRDSSGTGEAYVNAWVTRYDYDLYQQNACSSCHPGPALNFGGQAITASGNLYKTQELQTTSDVTTFSQVGLSNPGQASNTSYRDVRGNAFDALDRPTKKFSYTAVNGATSDTLSTETITYDIATTYSSNNVGKVASVCDALSPTQCTYDGYDSRGVLNAVTYDTSTNENKSMQFDADGHVAAIVQPAFGTHSYTFDADGRLAGSQEPSGGSVTSPATLTYHYYGNGERSALDVASSALSQSTLFSYSYRADGKLQTQQINLPSNARVGTSSLSFSYSPAGRLQQRMETGPAANATASTYNYDSRYGYLTEEDFPGVNKETSMEYDPTGALLGEVALPNYTTTGNTQKNTYSARGELISNTNLSGGAVASMANGVALNWPSRSSAVTNYVQVDTRMGVVVGTSNNASCGKGLSTAFDAAGRLTDEDVTLIGTGGTCLAYDNDMKRTYDQDNHVLTTAWNSNKGNANAAYDWGPNGHPIRIGQTPAGSTTIQYETLHWDGDLLLFTTNSSGNVDDIKIGELGDITPLDSGYGGLTFYDRDPSGVVVYCHNATGTAGKGLSNPKTFTSASGTVFHNSPCQAQSGQSMSAPASIIWWSDQPSGTYRIGSNGVLGMLRGDGLQDGFNTIQGVRTYDSSVGSWTTPDAYAGEVHDPMSQKSYVWNADNPVSFSDPTGFTPGCTTLFCGNSAGDTTVQPDDGSSSATYNVYQQYIDPSGISHLILVGVISAIETVASATASMEHDSAIATPMQVIAAIDAAAARTMADIQQGYTTVSDFWQSLTGWTNQQAAEFNYNFYARTDGKSMTVVSPEVEANVSGGAGSLALNVRDLIHNTDYQQIFFRVTLDKHPYTLEMHKFPGGQWSGIAPYMGPMAGGLGSDNGKNG